MSSAQFHLVMDKASADPVTVNWTTQDGTAIAGTDYTAASGVLTIPPGTLTGTVSVPLLAGATNGRIFDLKMSGLTNAVYSNATSSLTSAVTVSGVTASGGSNPVTTTLTYLTATGAVLKDTSGVAYVPRTVDWYGMESPTLCPNGLDQRAYKTIVIDGVTHLGIIDQIKAMGFNGFRFGICMDIMWSTNGSPADWTAANGRRPNSTSFGYIDPGLNPDFFTTTTGNTIYTLPQPVISSAEMLDLIVDYAGSIGLRVILDMHCLAPSASDHLGNSPAYNGADDTRTTAAPTSGQPNWVVLKRWYTTADRLSGGGITGVEYEYRDETQTIAAWVAYAKRYKNNPAVFGFDIINEPAGGSWETSALLSAANLDTSLPEWYERVGNAIHAVNPDVMIICEGPSSWRAGQFYFLSADAVADGTNATLHFASTTSLGVESSPVVHGPVVDLPSVFGGPALLPDGVTVVSSTATTVVLSAPLTHTVPANTPINFAPGYSVAFAPVAVTAAGDHSNDINLYPGFSATLMNVAKRPVTLTIPGKVMYSPHEYATHPGFEGIGSLSAANQAAWNLTGPLGFGHFYNYDPIFPANMADVWDKQWGFIARDGIGAVWIGECGADMTPEPSIGYTQLHIDADTKNFAAMNTYMRSRSIGWNWFALDPEGPGSPLGLLTDTSSGWSLTGNAFQMAVITPMQDAA